MSKKFTMQEFHAKYPDDNACLEAIWNHRFGDLSNCPKCERDAKFYRMKGEKHYDCAYCGYHLSPTAGTIFHKSSTSLKDWRFRQRTGASSRCDLQNGVVYG